MQLTLQEQRQEERHVEAMGLMQALRKGLAAERQKVVLHNRSLRRARKKTQKIHREEYNKNALLLQLM